MSREERTRQQTTDTFVRGLTIGALLGAVIAGSSIWSRRMTAKRTRPAHPADPLDARAAQRGARAARS